MKITEVMKNEVKEKITATASSMMNEEGIKKLINFILFIAKVTPKFILKNKVVSLRIWSTPCRTYGRYLATKY
jgi:hypothetical protein